MSQDWPEKLPTPNDWKAAFVDAAPESERKRRGRDFDRALNLLATTLVTEAVENARIRATSIDRENDELRARIRSLEDENARMLAALRGTDGDAV